jgi:hypothetical protein
MAAASDRPPLERADLLPVVHAIRTHCPIDWPEGLRCLNCSAPFPCVTNELAVEQLTEAGWSAEEISKLDQRTGPWS